MFFADKLLSSIPAETQIMHGLAAREKAVLPSLAANRTKLSQQVH